MNTSRFIKSAISVSSLRYGILNASNKRHFGADTLKKNIYVEENMGLREHTLHEFKFDGAILGKLAIGLFLPLLVWYNGIMSEFTSRDTNMGRPVRMFGIVPPSKDSE